ncbi:bifunctional folylpolyglutamate synthase/dihydrofolate synthase [candidate division TA06 bacterium]|nr:bifunctional folylpolyglutamate synthase/dihydrofolate synthase [candidate division TA06 bacterium]
MSTVSMMTFEESLRFLDSLIDNERTHRPTYPLDLESYRSFLASLGSPEKKLESPILIAGTKGKGSTATLIASSLQSNGFQVGLFTSPHLIHLRERISINGEPIPEEKFSHWMERITPLLKEVGEGFKPAPTGFRTVFEILTTIAFFHFLEKGVEYSIFEVGLGGRLDATNVTNPLVSVITSLSLDHTDILGGTLREIAREKAGIIRKNGTVVSAPQKEEALEVLEEVCEERGARLLLVGREIQYQILESSLTGTRFRMMNSEFSQRGDQLTIRTPNSEFFLPLLGDHQVENAAVAIGTLSFLGFSFNHLTNFHLTVPLRGRLEIVGERPWIVLDGAHNPYSAQCLREAIQSLFPRKRVILLCSILANKDIEGIAQVLSPLASEIILTSTNSPRTASLSLLQEKFDKFRTRSRHGGTTCQSIMVCEETVCALETARNLANQDDLILVTGSMYLVGDVIRLLSNDN